MNEATPIVVAMLGTAVQWVLMAPKNVHNVVAWVGIALAAFGTYVWMTPDAMAQFHTDWRAFVAGFVMFLFAIKGAASAAKAAKIAPQTDSK